jgi:hypothetical protein
MIREKKRRLNVTGSAQQHEAQVDFQYHALPWPDTWVISEHPACMICLSLSLSLSLSLLVDKL